MMKIISLPIKGPRAFHLFLFLSGREKEPVSNKRDLAQRRKLFSTQGGRLNGKDIDKLMKWLNEHLQCFVEKKVTDVLSIEVSPLEMLVKEDGVWKKVSIVHPRTVGVQDAYAVAVPA